MRCSSRAVWEVPHRGPYSLSDARAPSVLSRLPARPRSTATGWAAGISRPLCSGESLAASGLAGLGVSSGKLLRRGSSGTREACAWSGELGEGRFPSLPPMCMRPAPHQSLEKSRPPSRKSFHLVPGASTRPSSQSVPTRHKGAHPFQEPG